MPASSLPYEIQWKILDCLCMKDIVQYSLVSKHWREAAKHVMFKGISIYDENKAAKFIHLCAESPTTSNLIKKLTVRTDGVGNHAELYSEIIHLTPNVREIWVTRGASELYRVALQEIKHGHWPLLNHIGIYMQFGGTNQNLNQDYYAFASAIQDRLSHLNLRISSDFCSSELHCFQFPSSITRQTRFNAVRTLECYSDKKTRIRSIDDTLSLCPNATEIKLEIVSLDPIEERLMHIEPNTVVERLLIWVHYLSEAGVDYICRKFGRVKTLGLQFSRYGIHGYRVAIETFPLDISMKAAIQLANYVSSLDDCTLSIQGISECTRLLYAFSLLRWQGRMSISMYAHYFRLTYDKSKSNLSELNIDVDAEDAFLEQPSIKAYLNQLSRLSFRQMSPISHKIVPWCTRLQYLKMSYDTSSSYEGPLLPITHLDLTSLGENKEFLKQLSSYTPYLRAVKMLLDYRNGIEIDMPTISFNSLWVISRNILFVNTFYLHLLQSNKQTWYRSIDDKLCAIEASEFEKQELDAETVRIKLICREIKRFGLGNYHGSLYVEHDFD
ncbi:hypothetical protein BD560DRAFT_416681 [Blakeslea trispora]|nr:hypothetical protein BD560DRAFT_416681 [Blakeslea trispora]